MMMALRLSHRQHHHRVRTLAVIFTVRQTVLIAVLWARLGIVTGVVVRLHDIRWRQRFARQRIFVLCNRF